MKSLSKNGTICILMIMLALNTMSAQDRDGAMQKMKSFKKIMLIEKLNMSEEQAISFFARYQKYEEGILFTQNELKQALNQLDDLQKAGKGDYDKAIQAVFDKDMAMRKSYIERMKGMKGILSERQYAQFILIEHRLLGNLQKLMKRRQKK